VICNEFRKTALNPEPALLYHNEKARNHTPEKTVVFSKTVILI
jgi:hypothetical protein